MWFVLFSFYKFKRVAGLLNLRKRAMADQINSNNHPQQQNNQRIREQKLNSKYSLGFEAEDEFDPCSYFIIIIGYCIMIITFPVLFFLYLRICRHYERAVVFRLGRLREIKGPGLFYILPLIDRYKRVDLRLVSFQVPIQEVGFFLKINDPIQAVISLENAKNSTRLISSTTLRTVLGSFSIGDILSKREQVSKLIEDTIENVTSQWGIKIERFEIKNIHLPSNLKRSFAAQTEASRDSQAKLVAAEAEIRKSESLNSAAKILSNTPGALQLRYLQSLDAIGPNQKSNIVWPLPMEIMNSFCSTKNSSFNQPEFAPYCEELNENNMKSKQQRQPRPEAISPPPFNPPKQKEKGFSAYREDLKLTQSRPEEISPPIQVKKDASKNPVPREKLSSSGIANENTRPQRFSTPPTTLSNTMFVTPRYSDIKPSMTSPPLSPSISTTDPVDEILEEDVRPSRVFSRYSPQNQSNWAKDSYI